MPIDTTQPRRTRAPLNGVDTPTLCGTLDVVKGQPDLARFQFRARNRWKSGTLSETTIDSFSVAGGEHTHKTKFRVNADHPAVLRLPQCSSAKLPMFGRRISRAHFCSRSHSRCWANTTRAATWRREGIRRAEHVLALNPLDGRAMSLGSLYLFEEGQTARAIEWSDRALALYPNDMSSLGNGACLQAKLGHADRAIELLERVSALGWGQRDWLERDPDYDNLRGDPRFQRVLTTFK